MFRNKLLQLSIIILIAVTLIIVAVFVLLQMMDKKSTPNDPNQQAINSVENVKVPKKSAQEIKDSTVEIKDVITNLADKSFIKISFAFEMDNKKTGAEFQLLEFRVKAKILETLASLTADQISDSKGRDSLIATLMNKINPILTMGKIKQIDITDFQLQ